MSAEELKVSGNAMFLAKDFTGAICEYSKALSSVDVHALPALAAILYTNRAGCHDELGNIEEGISDLKNAISLHPTYSKPYYRLAKALTQQEDHEGAARAIFAAAALSLLSGRALDPLLTKMYHRLRIQTLNTPLALPEAPESIVVVLEGTSISALVHRHPSPIALCVLPGTYFECILIPSEDSMVLIGLGEVTLHQLSVPLGKHTIDSYSGAVSYVSGVTLTGGRAPWSQAAIAALGSCCVIHDCKFENYAASGVIVVGEGSLATLSHCVFKNLAHMAIEVREGASLECRNVVVDRCKGGICAHGGAKDVTVVESRFSNCQGEGVSFVGSMQSTQGSILNDIMKERNPPRNASQRQMLDTHETADEWGRSNGMVLTGSMRHTSFQNCGEAGFSISRGARGTVYGCLFSNNDPSGIFVSGGSDLSVVACRIEYSNEKSKAQSRKRMLSMLPQYQKNMRMSLKEQGGIYLDANLNGTIRIESCIMIGENREYCIYDSVAKLNTPDLIGAALYTKPARLSLNSYFPIAKAGEAPTINELMKLLPSVGKPSSAPGPDIASGKSIELRPICTTRKRAQWSPGGSQYYAIGNTFGYDVAETKDLQPCTNAIRVLLGACGDIRNLLETVWANPSKRFEFVLNDTNAAMLARNAVLIHMIERNLPADCVLAVWANHALTEKQYSEMMSSIATLAENAWSGWIRAAQSLLKKETAAAASVRSVLRSWLTSDVQLGKMKFQRSASLSMIKDSNKRILQLTKNAVGVANAANFHKELRDYIESGTLNPPGSKITKPTRINVTFLNCALQYDVYFTSSIFRAIRLNQQVASSSAHKMLLQTLMPKFDMLAKKLRSNDVSVTFSNTDILSMLTSQPEQKTETFDFIDCSNIMDYVSMPALVQAATHCLNTLPHARLRLESLTQSWDESQNVRTFVESRLGYPLPIFENLMEIALDMELSKSLDGFKGGVRLEFVNSPRKSILPWSIVYTGLLSSKSLSMYGCHSNSSSNSHNALVSPITLVHLLTTSSLRFRKNVVRTFLRCGGSNLELYGWEIVTHAKCQLSCSKPDGISRLKFVVHPTGLYLLDPDCTLVLAVSEGKILDNGVVPVTEVRQLVTSFAWSEDSSIAEFLLDTNLFERAANLGLHVTLLQIQENGIFAISKSLPLCTLSIESVPDVITWRSSRAKCDSNIPDEFEDVLNELSQCGHCNKVDSGYKKCARCGRVCYCSKECQGAHWRKVHKKACQRKGT